MKTPILFLSLLIATVSASVSAGTCNRGDIDHYLKSGFSHDQIVKLCGTQKAPPRPAAPAPIAAAAPAATNSGSAESIFFKTAIAARKLDVLQDKIVYISKECMKFGLPDMTGEKEKTCKDVETTINYQGLQVISAHEGVPLIQKRELILGGNFTRRLVHPERIIARHKKDFFEDFATTPQNIDVPVRKGFDPQEVGQRLLAIAAN